MSKVRIINDKTGEVKWVSSYVAEQTKQLATYGFRVEDPKVTFAFDPLKKVEEKEDDIKIPEGITINEDGEAELEFDTVELVIDYRAKYFEVFGKKPGNKSEDTMKKEIESELSKEVTE